MQLRPWLRILILCREFEFPLFWDIHIKQRAFSNNRNECQSRWFWSDIDGALSTHTITECRGLIVSYRKDKILTLPILVTNIFHAFQPRRLPKQRSTMANAKHKFWPNHLVSNSSSWLQEDWSWQDRLNGHQQILPGYPLFICWLLTLVEKITSAPSDNILQISLHWQQWTDRISSIGNKRQLFLLKAGPAKFLTTSSWKLILRCFTWPVTRWKKHKRYILLSKF